MTKENQAFPYFEDSGAMLDWLEDIIPEISPIQMYADLLVIGLSTDGETEYYDINLFGLTFVVHNGVGVYELENIINSQDRKLMTSDDFREFWVEFFQDKESEMSKAEVHVSLDGNIFIGDNSDKIGEIHSHGENHQVFFVNPFSAVSVHEQIYLRSFHNICDAEDWVKKNMNNHDKVTDLAMRSMKYFLTREIEKIFRDNYLDALEID